MKEEYLLTSELEYTNEPYAVAKIAGIKMCESYNLQYGTNFISVQPTNLYGPNDNFDLEKSHVLPALLRKLYLGMLMEKGNWNEIRLDFDKLPIEGVTGTSTKQEMIRVLEKYGVRLNKEVDPRMEVEIWGSGKPLREFLWSEDMADACVYLMENVDFSDMTKAINGEVKNTHINIGTGVEISIKELAETIKEVVGFDGNLFFNSEKPDGTLRKLTSSAKLKKLGWEYNTELKDGIRMMYHWYTNKRN
jgi:GDP-L-fucose synthase